MAKTFYLSSSSSDLTVGGAEWTAQLVESTESSSTRYFEVKKNTTEFAASATNANMPSTNGSTGNYTIEVNVTQANSSLYLSVQVHRINSTGTIQTSSSTSSEQQLSSTGVKTFTFTSLDLGTWASGDRFLVYYNLRNADTKNAQATYFGTGTTSEEHVTPWTIATNSQIDVDPGSYSHTGTTTTFDIDMPADTTSYSYTGTAADLEKAISFSVDPGSYSYTGTEPSLEADREIVPDTDSYSYTGTDVTFQINYQIDPEIGTYSVATKSVPSIVQVKKGYASNSNAVTTTLDSATTEGNFLLAVLHIDDPTYSATLAATPAGWTSLHTRATWGSANAQAWAWYRENAPSISSLSTTLDDSVNGVSLTVIEVSGIVSSSAIDSKGTTAYTWFSSTEWRSLNCVPTTSAYTYFVGWSVSKQTGIVRTSTLPVYDKEAEDNSNVHSVSVFSVVLPDLGYDPDHRGTLTGGSAHNMSFGVSLVPDWGTILEIEMPAATESYSYTGTDASLEKTGGDSQIDVDPGSYSYTGTAASLEAAREVATDVGSYSYADAGTPPEPAVVQAKTNYAASDTSVTVTMDSSTTAGNFLLACAMASEYTSTWNTPSGWTLIRQYGTSNSYGKAAWFYYPNAPAKASETFSISTSSTNVSATIVEVSGVAPVQPINLGIGTSNDWFITDTEFSSGYSASTTATHPIDGGAAITIDCSPSSGADTTWSSGYAGYVEQYDYGTNHSYTVYLATGVDDSDTLSYSTSGSSAGRQMLGVLLHPTSCPYIKQYKIGGAASSTTVSATFDETTDAGNLLLAYTLSDNATYTHAQPTNFTQILQGASAPASMAVRLSYRANAPATDTISALAGTTVNGSIIIAEVANMATSSVIDSNASEIDFTYAQYQAQLSPTTTAADTLCLAFACSTSDLTSLSITTGEKADPFINIENDPVNTHTHHIYQRRYDTQIDPDATGTITPTASIAVAAAAFVPDIGGTAPSVAFEILREVAPEAGSYLHTGTAANLEKAYNFEVDPDAYSHTGTVVDLSKTTDKEVVPDPGVYAFAGTTVDLEYDRIMEAGTDSYSYAGTAALTEYHRVIPVEISSYSHTGTAVDFLKDETIDIVSGYYNVVGLAVSLQYSGAVQVFYMRRVCISEIISIDTPEGVQV